VLDALSAEHNRFFEYLGRQSNVKYIQVKDFECNMLPESYFDYMFSFGCLCHVSFDGIEEYAENIFPKLKRNSNCFWMVADYEKYDQAILNLKELSIWRPMMIKYRKVLPLKWLFWYLMKKERLHKVAENDKDLPGRWYNAGKEKTCSMLERVGYQILDPDVGVSLRDPVIHFVKK
jgi:hypothetical protein